MKDIQLKDFLNFKAPSSLTLSPNGEVIAFVVTEIKDNKYVKSLHIIKNGKEKKLFEDEKLGSFEFLDDNTISFSSVRGKKDEERQTNGEMFTSFYEIKLDGGEAYKSYELPLPVSKIKKIDERYSLVLGGLNKKYPDLYKLKGKERNKVFEQIKNSKDYEELTESPYVFNGTGFIQNLRENLFLFDKKTKSLTRLLDANFTVNSFLIDGRDIYIVGQDVKKSRIYKSGVYLYNLDSKDFKEIIPTDKDVMILEKLGDTFIAFAEKENASHMGFNPYIYRLDVNKKELVLLNRYDESLGNEVLTDVEFGSTRFTKVDNNYLYYLVNSGYYTYLKRVDCNGKVETVIDLPGAVDDFDVIGDRIVFSGLYDNILFEVYEFAKGNKKRISDLNMKYVKSHEIHKPEYLKTEYKGEEIDGWVILPKDYDPSKTYPGVLDIHGGPQCAYGDVYFHEMQVWAAKGYFVFFCNPHGSSGKGNDFADLAMHWGEIDFEHIMAFVDNVLKHYPSIDANRLGCTGGSYGGFMSNWIMGHTDRFKCIATQRSISNWISMYGIGDITPRMCDWTCDTNPYSEEGFKKMWKSSPLKYIDNAKTPTLIIHSECDFRCPVSEGYQLYTALVYKGIPTKMVMFHGENHELSRGGKPTNRVKRLEEITGWFDKYLH